MGIEFGFQFDRFLPGKESGRNFRFFTGPEKLIPEMEAVLREGDEKAVCLFNTVRGNLSENSILRDAFPCRFRIADSVSPPAVKKAVVSSGGARSKVLFFNDHRGNSPQGQISRD